MAKMSNSITDRRIDILLIFEVRDGTWNNDPDESNEPRMDHVTGQAIGTDACLKRRIRDTVTLMTKSGSVPENGNDIFVVTDEVPDEERILNREMEAAYKTLKIKPGDDGAIGKARQYMCQKYFDVRSFGAVMSTGKDSNGSDNKFNAGCITGPIQVGIARTFDRVDTLPMRLSRKCVTSEDDAKKQLKKSNCITGTFHSDFNPLTPNQGVRPVNRMSPLISTHSLLIKE